VKGGKEYVFFSKEHAERTQAAAVEEYMLFTSKAAEQNSLYIIFSPHDFTKANDGKAADLDGRVLPRELTFEEFQRWLAKNRGRDKDMKVEIKSLMIKK
jgi:hypothetical protein